MESEILYAYKCDNYYDLEKLNNHLLNYGYKYKYHSHMPMDFYKNKFDGDTRFMYVVIFKDKKIHNFFLTGVEIDFDVIDAKNKVREIKLDKINNG